MSADKYPSIFSRQKATIVYLFTASVSESEILKIQEDAVPENTKKATKFGMKVFRGKRRLHILKTSVLPFIILDTLYRLHVFHA